MSILFQNKRLLGIVFAILTMIILGLLPVYSYVLIQKVDPLLFGGITCLIGSIPFIIKVHKNYYTHYLFKKTQFSRELFLLTLFATCSAVLFVTGAKLTSGINTTLLTQIEPLYGTLLPVIILGERLKKAEDMAVAQMEQDKLQAKAFFKTLPV